MQTSTAFRPVAPRWSSIELADAVPCALPPLHRFDFSPPANAMAMHRPRRSAPAYAAAALPERFRVR